MRAEVYARECVELGKRQAGHIYAWERWGVNLHPCNRKVITAEGSVFLHHSELT